MFYIGFWKYRIISFDYMKYIKFQRWYKQFVTKLTQKFVVKINTIVENLVNSSTIFLCNRYALN